jgi:hypothetical protein
MKRRVSWSDERRKRGRRRGEEGEMNALFLEVVAGTRP